MCLFLLILSFLVLSSTGCEKKRLAEPENEDYIFKDYKIMIQNNKDTLRDLNKNYSAAEKDFKQSLINSAEAKIYKNEMKRIKKNIAVVEQLLRYLDVKKANRKYEVREKYIKAFKTGSEWPNQLEIEEYKASKRLHQASKDWESRVPSFKDRYRAKNTFIKETEKDKRDKNKK